MQEKSPRIVIEFKGSSSRVYANKYENLEPNLLIIEINPNGNITLQLNHKNLLHDGKMGLNLGENLIDHKHQVVAYDLNSHAVDEIKAYGGEIRRI